MNYLQNKTVIIKPVIRTRPFFSKGHDGEHTYSGCKKTYFLPYVNSTSSFAKIFESKEEQAFFEEALALPKGSLSLHNIENVYWNKKFFVEISKEGLVLDLNNPVHALKLKILLASREVADSWAKRNSNPSFLFAVWDEEVADDSVLTSSAKTMKAMKLLFKLEKSPEDMYNLLRLLNIKLDAKAKSKPDVLIAKLNTVIEQKNKVIGIPNIDDFLKLAEDPSIESRILALDSIESGYIELVNGVYRLSDTQLPIGTSINDVVLFLENKENSENKIVLKTKLKNKI